MTEVWWKDAEQDEVHETAADWFAKLQQANISPEELLAWQRWMTAHERNAEAFARLEAVCAAMRNLKRPTPSESWRVGKRPYDGSISISQWLQRSYSRSWMALAASLAAIVILLSGIAYDRYTAQPVVAQLFESRVGENRAVRLADGSRITLGGNTQIRVNFTPTARRIELTQGEAYFTVAKERSRPFTVLADETVVTAIGTEFNVRRRQNRLDVTVVEGQVIVDPTSPSVSSIVTPAPTSSDGSAPQHLKFRSVRVSAGEKIVIGAADVVPARVDDATTTTAWRSGRLMFNHEALRDVMEDVNRYSKKRIATDDPAIGELMFTGTVMDGNVSGWISSIENIFALEAVEEPDRILLRRRFPPKRTN